MKHLVVLCHPSADSLSQVIGAELAQLYNKYKIEVEVRDLYKIGFNPVLNKEDLDAEVSGNFPEDVLREQKYITNAEIIVFIYPIWWTGMPAMLKGYMERIFSEGFAYSHTKEGIKKLLENKQIVIVNTYKESHSLYSNRGLYDKAAACEKYIFESFGMEVILHYYLENIEENMDSHTINLRVDDLRKEIKRSLIISNNSRLNIPTAFF